MAKPFRKHLRNLLITTLAWIGAISLFALVRLYGVEEEGTYELTASRQDIFKQILILGLGVGTTFGLVFGALDTFKSVLRNAPYWLIILVRTIIHVGITLLIIPAYLLIYHWILGDVVNGSLIETVTNSPYQKTALILIIYTGMASMFFNIIRQMNAMYGPGILYNILMGKYHRPKEEERIFMFLDLKSSTTYAERLGHVLYSELIQDCFFDLTETVDQHEVEIYQYVGDEAVLTWKVEQGMKDANCVMAFFTFDATIQGRADYYFNKYGLVPAFKAGINLGLVMVAEVGVIKKEIAYHSDVLNTAARIQGRCNEFSKQVLISEALQKRLTLPADLKTEMVGTLSLKGKEKKITIYSVEKVVREDRKYEFTE